MKIICGFQDGADIAGARAAKAAGLETFGWMPPEFMTSSGPHPEYADLYGAKALDPEVYRNMFGEIDPDGWKRAYRQRTMLNAQSADTTVWFGDPSSPGGKLTFKHHCGCWYVVENLYSNWGPWDLALMLAGCKAVNIAGNRESSSPRIGVWVEAYLAEVFRILKAKR